MNHGHTTSDEETKAFNHHFNTLFHFLSSDRFKILYSSLLQELSTQETNILGTYCDVSVSVDYMLDIRSKYSRPDCEGGKMKGDRIEVTDLIIHFLSHCLNSTITSS